MYQVSRAFSFNKSPGGKLKRAVSTVMSPFATLPNQSMRAAASVTNLTVSPFATLQNQSMRAAASVINQAVSPCATLPSPSMRAAASVTNLAVNVRHTHRGTGAQLMVAQITLVHR